MHIKKEHETKNIFLSLVTFYEFGHKLYVNKFIWLSPELADSDSCSYVIKNDGEWHTLIFNLNKALENNIFSLLPSFIFSGISAIISHLFASESDSNTVTEEDLLNIIETIEDEGVLEPEKQALVNSAIEFATKVAEDIMIPIEEMVSVSSTTPVEKLAAFLKTSPYSRVPVYEGSKDNIVGILPVTVFLSRYAMKAPITIRKMLMKPYVFDSKTEITELLSRMRLNKLHMVFICDENKNKIGIITMEDILEELVGDIQDESDTGEGLHLM